MYWEYFGFDENPFSIAPDPRYLYMSKRHQEALAHLVYGIGEGGGFVLLTGEVGTGKTTLCRSLIEQLPDGVDLAFVLNPRVNEIELLATICEEMGVPYARENPSLKLLVDRLNQHLLAANARGRQPVLLIDEAQNLSPGVLEQVRLLTNFETTTRKLLKIVLIGQPELRDVLRRPGLRQLDQRITARYHLEPLSAAETAGYVRHRLEVAGATREIFTPRAIREVHRRSGGVPRLINTLCDRALLGAYGQDRSVVDRRLVRGAASEVRGRDPQAGRGRWRFAAAAATVAIAGAVVAADRYGLRSWPGLDPGPGPGPVSEAAATTAAAEPVLDDVFVTAAGPTTAALPGVGSDPGAAATPPAEVPPSPAAGFTVARLPAPPISEPPAAMIAVAMLPPPWPPGPAGATADEAVVMAAVTPPSATRPAPVSLEDRLSGPGSTGDFETAVADLFAVWGFDYEELTGMTACRKARAVNLLCQEGSTDWHQVRIADLPVVMTLHLADGRRVHLALTGLGDGSATVIVGGEQVETTVATLSALWTGDYLMLWRPPYNFERQLKPGVKGEDVVWLQNRLAELRGAPPAKAARAVFDDSLAAQVRMFQRDHELEVDGVAGPRTMIRLSQTMPGYRAPSLR